MTFKKMKENDRVRRVVQAGQNRSVTGVHGTVKSLRYELSSLSHDTKEKVPMIQVQWDNGTLSYFGPEGLELV